MWKSATILMMAVALAVAACGCGSSGHSGVQPQRQIVVIRNEDSMSDIIAANQRQQEIQMKQNQQFMRNMDNTMYRMRGTMGRFGQTVYEANRMRRSRW